MKKIRNAFVTGLLVLVPLMATIDILRWFVRFLDSGVRSYIPDQILPFDFWGLGIVISVLIVLVTGILTQNYVGTWIIAQFDKLIRKFPLIGGIYSSIKKFMETIFNPSSTQFKQAVMVEFPKPGFYSVGFLTGKPSPEIQEHSKKKLVNIFIPLVPNPTSGFYLVLPEEEVIPLKLSVQEAFKIVISMGIVSSTEKFQRLDPLNPGQSEKIAGTFPKKIK